MKIGQAVRVIACESGHQFDIGEIVYRTPAPEDDANGVGFKNSDGKLWYMSEDEYEIVVTLDEDAARRKILREEGIAFLERYISQNEIFQAAIEAVAEDSEEAEYLRGLTVAVELY